MAWKGKGGDSAGCSINRVRLENTTELQARKLLIPKVLVSHSCLTLAIPRTITRQALPVPRQPCSAGVQLNLRLSLVPSLCRSARAVCCGDVLSPPIRLSLVDLFSL